MKIIISALFILFISNNAFASDNLAGMSLCQNNESIVFSCAISKTKFVSICASNSSLAALKYRFGTPRKIELSYPPEGGVSKFRYSKYSRYQTEYIRLGFSIENYNYYIFRNYDESQDPSQIYGIALYKKNDESNETTINCKSQIIDNLQIGLKQAECNEESALGCDSTDD